MREYIRSKIQKGTVTHADVNYEGSITIDEELIDLGGFHLGEKVLVVDTTNGARLETYIIPGERYSGQIQMNGAAALLIHKGDGVIIMGFELSESPIPRPTTITLGEGHRI